MTFAKYKPEKRWTCVWIVELIKVFFKLLLLIRRRGRIILLQGHPLRATINTLPNFARVDGDDNDDNEDPKHGTIAPLRSIVAEVAYIR